MAGASTTEPRARSRVKGVVKTLGRLLTVNVLIRVASASTGQLMAFLIAERHGGRIAFGSLLVGFVGMAFFVTELLGAPVAGRLADRHGSARILKAGPLFGVVAVSLAAAAALAFDGSAWFIGVLVLARLAEGASAACLVPPTLVTIARATAGDAVRRTRAMGAFEIGSLVGIIAGFALSGLAWDAIGVYAFLLLAPVYFTAWVVVPAAETRSGGSAAGERLFAVLGRVARQPGAAWFGVAWLAVIAVVGLWVQYIPYLLRLPVASAGQHLVGGFSGTLIGLVFSLWGLTFMAGLALWSWLGGAMARRTAMGISLAGMVGLTLALFLANHGPDPVALPLGVVAMLVAAGFTPAAFAHLADITEHLDGSRGAAIGLYSLFFGLGQLVGGGLGAPVVAQWHLDGLLMLTLALVGAALVGVARMRGVAGEAPEPLGDPGSPLPQRG